MNETETLFTRVLRCDRAALYLDKQKALDKTSAQRIASALERRAAGEPLEYILGTSEFMGWEFRVSPDVLIPRQDTEILVETAIAYGMGRAHTDKGLKILEIGTGSGCIAISLAKSLPSAHIIATDISEAALRIAEENACANAVAERIDFIHCDLFDPALMQGNGFDLIVSNPPYIASDVINTLQAEVQAQPRLALDGGTDGLDFYRRTLERAPLYMAAWGLIIFEIGYDQKEAVAALAGGREKFAVKEIIRDYNGIERVVVFQIKECHG